MKVVFEFFRTVAIFADAGDPLQGAVDFVEGNDRSAGEDYTGRAVSSGNNFGLPVDGSVRKPLAKGGQP